MQLVRTSVDLIIVGAIWTACLACVGVVMIRIIHREWQC